MKITKHADKWRLDGYDAKGRRVRSLFATRAKAESIAKQMELDKFNAKHGIKTLSDSQQAVAIRVFNMLPADANLFEIINEWLTKRKASNQTSIENAIKLFDKDLKKRNKRDRYIDSMVKQGFLGTPCRILGSWTVT